MYPKALMSWLPLSSSVLAMFPHVLESSCLPPVPNPILELQEWQSPFSLPRIPILALERVLVHSALNPSLWGRWASRRHQDQLRSSTCHDPVRRCGIAAINDHYQWTRALGDFNKIDLVVDLQTDGGRSWRRMCSSRWEVWSPSSQTPSFPLSILRQA